MNTLIQNLRYAIRQLHRRPGFTAAFVLTLGLGIGAAAAMFSVIDALLLKPLPYGDSDELVRVETFSEEDGTSRYFAFDEAAAWRDAADFMDGIMLHTRATALFTGGSEPRTLPAEVVGPQFQEVMQVRPLLGRSFTEDDTEPGAEHVVIVSYAFWRSAFGADPEAIGERIELDGVRHRIVGVMPEGFKFPTYSTTDVWLPLSRTGTFLGEDVRSVEVLGRTGEDGLEPARARATATSIALSETIPDITWTAQLFPMEDERRLGEGTGFLSGAVAMILLIAAVNSVSLLLVRGWSRIRELAVRTALGASRRRLISQLVTESTLLALLSGAAAVILALGIVAIVRGILPSSLVFFAPHPIEVEWRTIGFTFSIAVAAGLIIGLIPALQATTRSSAAAEAGLTAYSATTRSKNLLRQGLVVGSVTLSVILLMGAGLLINSFTKLARIDPGYRVEELAMMYFSMSPGTYPTSEARGQFLQRLESRLEALPGVERVTMPWGMTQFGVAFQVEGQTAPTTGQPTFVPASSVTPDYFEVMEIPIRAGRSFTSEDAGTDNVIIDADLARFLWAGTSPIGESFRMSADRPWQTVVGVIGDLKLEGPDSRKGDYEILYPSTKDRAGSYVQMAIRTSGDPEPLFNSIRAVLNDLDPQQPIHELRPATEIYAEFIDMEKFLFVLMSVLSGLALVLAAIGIHGILAFAVTQRQRELGIRIALGARSEALAKRVIGEGLALAVIGVALGIAGALALSRLVRSLLYDVEPSDPLTIVAIATITILAAAIASYRPAMRATRVDPVEVLRAE